MPPSHMNLYGLVTFVAPNPIKFIGFRWAFISQTPVVHELSCLDDDPLDPGRNRPKTPDFLWELTVQTLPWDPPGEGGGAKKQIENRLKHS